jgi:GT2 family glycosyltransferase
MPARDPVPAPFIVGTGRSGTTLLRMMLDAHSQLAIPPETNFGPAQRSFERDGAGAAVDTLVSAPFWGDFGLGADELAGKVEEQRPAVFGDFMRLFYVTYAERKGKSRWGDKSPFYVRAMGRIHRYLPEASFVHVVRDGRDVALSINPLWFGPDTVAEMARLWVDTLVAAREQAQLLPRYLEIRYEDLVYEPAVILQGVCDFLALGWERSMLDYHREARERIESETVSLALPDGTVSRDRRIAIHSSVGLPPQPNRAQRWRREMSAADLRAFEEIAGDVLTDFGYELSGAGGRPEAQEWLVPADAAVSATTIRRRLGPPLELSRWPRVSIVVLNRDGAGLLRRLLAGLTERTDYPELELILVDNASSDDSLDFIRSVETPFPISVVANAHNESFADACNQGAELACGELLLFLNNDVEPIEPGWLRELVVCLHKSGAGAVGPTLLEPVADSPRGLVVHQRGLRTRDHAGLLVPAYRDHLADPLGPGLGVDVESVALAAACLLVDRGVFDGVDGFTSGYWYGPEDVDLALKLREQGLPSVCSGRSLVVHPPSSTLKTVDGERRRAWIKGNRRLFLERWGPRVRREYELDRLSGGGLWAEPPDDGAPSSGATPAELQALGFCLRADGLGEEVGPSASLDEIANALRERGHRCLVAHEAAEDDLAPLEYDVAVYPRGPRRLVPRPAQLNVLWCVSHLDAVGAIECSGYDLVVCAHVELVRRLREEGGDDLALAALDGSTAASLASGLVEAVAARAGEIGFRTRIGGALSGTPTYQAKARL